MAKRTVKKAGLPVSTQVEVDDLRSKLAERRYVKITYADGKLIEEEFMTSLNFPSGPRSGLYVLADDSVNRNRLRSEVEALLRKHSEMTDIPKQRPQLSVVQAHPDFEFLEALCDPEKADKYIDRNGIEQRPSLKRPPMFFPNVIKK